MSREIRLGSAAVVVQSTDFTDGYRVGYSWFLGYCEGTPINEAYIYGMMASTITNIRKVSNYNAGYVCGWIAALHEKEDGPCALSSLCAQLEDEPLSFFGPVEEVQL